MNSPIHQDTRIAAFAEGQMRSWARAARNGGRQPVERNLAVIAGKGYATSTISREAGAEGAVVARLVGGAPRVASLRSELAWIRLPSATRNRD